MFSKVVLVCFFAALVLAEQDQERLDKGEKQQQQDTLIKRTVNKNIVDYTEKVQQNQPSWQQYKPVIQFTRDSEGIRKIVRLPFNPYFQGVRVNVKPYPGGYVAIRTNGAEIVKPFTDTPDTTEKDEEIIIESQTPEEQQQQILQQQLQQQQLQQQILQQQQQGYQRNIPYFYPQQQEYLTKYPSWSRFLQPQYQQQRYQQQEYPIGEDIYNQEQGEYDRAVRDTKKDKKSRGDKQQEQQDKYEREGLYDQYRMPLNYQQYQRVPYQIYDQQQQQFYQQQQGPYTNQLLNRWLGLQQYDQQYPYFQQQQQYPYYQQQYQLPVYAI